MHEVQVGDVVLDDLTCMYTVVTKVFSYGKFQECITVSSPYIFGMRFPWEVTKFEDTKCGGSK